MKKEVIQKLHTSFEDVAHEQDGVEFWLARDLQVLLEKAKDFATEITNFNVKKEDLHGEQTITREHVKNNTDVRKLLTKRNIYPENLPPEEDVRKLERPVSMETKKALEKTKKLKPPKEDKQ